MHLPSDIAEELFSHIRIEMDHYIRNDNSADERQCNFCYSSYLINHRDPIAARSQHISHDEGCLGIRLLKLYEEEANSS